MPTSIGFAPGPRGLPYLGVLPQLRRDAPGLFVWARENFGDFVTLPVAGRRILLLSDPASVKHVMLDNARNYRKGRGIQKIRELLGNGLLNSEGDFWLRQRRLAQPAFHRERLARMALGMQQVTEEQWLPQLHGAAHSGAPLDLGSGMTSLTLSVVARALFGAQIAPEDLKAVERSMPAVLDRGIRRTRAVSDRPPLPTPRERQAQRAAAELDRVVHSLIEARRAGPEGGDDLLGMLIEATGEDGRMDDQQLRDEVMTLFLAGHETTASLLTSLFWFLGDHPAVLARVEAELDAAPGIGADSVRTLPYLMACIHEALRLSPPAWTIPREALQEDQLLGYRVTPGSAVMISPYVIHRHPDFWEEPLQFRPERFLEKGERHSHAYLPFGAGPRGCIGNNFALMEAAIIAGLSLKHHRLTPLGPLRLQPSVTLRPAGPALMRVTAR
ncbi:cytochrome P450 [Deinococcus sonorensis]|uniref:Cytochrome P450 n=2 Tax=Deinococcus sonorensis TaxID=309891 RepID=A0AAU7U8F4_9DEIO